MFYKVLFCSFPGYIAYNQFKVLVAGAKLFSLLPWEQSFKGIASYIARQLLSK